jgi:predicted DsbA family dithiol-disulfide isomerase
VASLLSVQPVLRVHHFTDPGCPFAFSAEPSLRRLAWTYGDQLEWNTRMIVLSRSPEEYLERGFTPEVQVGALKNLAQQHGMPIDSRQRPRMAATEPACRAVVATRRHDPARADALLRRLRVHTMSGDLLDEQATINVAAHEAGLDPAAVRAWAAEAETTTLLEDDAAAARRPDAAGRALVHKLAGAGDDLRYTAPSLVFERVADGATATVPGFQPYAAYDVAVANLAPELERRPAAEDPVEVLTWAGEPLATVEVAAVRGVDSDTAREELARVADLRPVGPDGYWSPRERARQASELGRRDRLAA